MIRANHLAHAGMVEAVRQSIVSGALPIESRLPSERALAEAHGISVTSVRRGMAILERDGVVVRRQGSGTYVAAVPQTAHANAVRDVVAIVPTMAMRHYHPYFSEFYTALREHLLALGWQDWDCTAGVPRTGAPNGDVSWIDLDKEAVADALLAQPGVAAALIGATLAESLVPRLDGRFPVVALNATEMCPYVDYDWEHETERALRHVLRTGARHIWGYSGLTPEQKAQITHRAVAAECPGARPRPVVRWHPIDFRSAILSEHVRSAFDAATSELTVGRPIDGIVAGDDFITQGILDALTKQGRRIPEDLAFVGLINKTSRIHSPYLFTSLVADGQLAARETAALVDAHVRHRERAPRRVILSCELRMP